MNVTAAYSNYNITNFTNENTPTSSKFIILSVVLIICCVGLPENGIVIWLLGFQVKRNPFSMLILNLAIADFGFLLFMAIYCIFYFGDCIPVGIPWLIFLSFCHIMYINGLFLLTAISVDRCVSVLFPIWHHCSRPKYLSPAVCALLWIFSFLLAGIVNTTKYVFQYSSIMSLHMMVTVVLCLPLMTTSTVILFIKIGFKTKQNKRGRILVITLITLLCFLILIVPLYLYLIIANFLDKSYFKYSSDFDNFFDLCACLNCSVNPVIYFLVGRNKQAQSRENIKVIFQRVFKDDEVSEIR